jgi:hypothetical protein
MAPKADKFKTCIIIYTGEYNRKEHKVVMDNNLHKRHKIPRIKSKNQ